MTDYLDPRIIKEPKPTAPEIWTPEKEKHKHHLWSINLQPGVDEIDDQVAAHNLVYEHGALVFTEKRDDQWVVVRIYAPGTWQHVFIEENE